MDDSALDTLRAALAASPDNLRLFEVVATELLRRDEASEARALLDPLTGPAREDTSFRRLAARILLATGDAEGALPWATETDGDTLIVRARILSALDRKAEAAEAYKAAVAANPTLEDVELQSLLKARTRDVDGRAGTRLRVISNDDTDDTEMTRLLMPAPGVVRFSDVGGLDEVKAQITRKIITPFRKPSLFERFRKRVGGGILLYGPPGCGKTLLARATAGECEAAFFNVAIADVLDMYIGESERKLHAIFEKARASAPAILFFDELEGLAGRRQYTREATSSKLVSQFLSEMDGFTQQNRGVLILGATNVPWAIDPAFRRAGRFDRVLFVPPPDRTARASILRHKLAERPTDAFLPLDALAQRTSGFSGADLDNLIETASDEAIEASLALGREVPLSGDHLLRALEAVKPTTSEWLTTARNYARYANEAGQYDEVLEFLRVNGKA